MPDRCSDDRVVYRAILAVASWLTPRYRRNEWLREWRAELWHLLHANREEGLRVSAVSFCMGAFHDAAWLRARSVAKYFRELVHLQSPLQCLAVLSAIAAMSVVLFCAVPAVRDAFRRQPMPAHVLVLSLAFLILPSTTTLAVGLNSGSGTCVSQLRCRIFLGVKFVLLAAAIFFATSDAAPFISRSGLQPQAALVGYVLAFRWALNDQRRRCPACLRLLTDPVRIGQAAGTLLEWYGTEFVCARGHGVLHMPELLRSSYCSRQWVTLDPSWQDLFERR